MLFTRRLVAAAIGLLLPLAAAATAEAAPRHHRPAQLRTATYKVTPHKAVRHRTAALNSRRVAQAHRHSIMRGS